MRNPASKSYLPVPITIQAGGNLHAWRKFYGYSSKVRRRIAWIRQCQKDSMSLKITAIETLFITNCFGGSVLTWWRHQMETFSALLAICAGNSPVPGEFPTQMPVTRSFDVFFDLRLNKRSSKQCWGWWFETLSRPLWRHRNDFWLVPTVSQ